MWEGFVQALDFVVKSGNAKNLRRRWFFLLRVLACLRKYRLTEAERRRWLKRTEARADGSGGCF